MVREEEDSSEDNFGEFDDHETLVIRERPALRSQCRGSSDHLAQFGTRYSANEAAIRRTGHSTEKKREKDKTEKRGEKGQTNGNRNKPYLSYCLPILVAAILLYLFQCKWLKPHELNIGSELELLKRKYPGQSSFTWRNILKVINTTDSVQSLVILYKKDNLAAECLAKDLGALISKIYNAKDLSLYKSVSSADVTDYGEELDYYLHVLKERKYLIVLNLQKIPGNIAKMFHFLCDDYKENIPSHFIFTLE